MGIFGWIFYSFSGIIMFLCLYFLEHHYAIQKLERFIFSIIIWLFLSGICFHFALPYTDDIFLIFVFLMIIDIIYCSYFLDRDFFDKQEKNILYYTILVLFGFFLNQCFINKVNQVFLTGEEIRCVLWFLIFVFLYYFCKDKEFFHKIQSSKHEFLSDEAILLQYTKLRYKYGRNLTFKNNELSFLLYAIMIYENHNRSKIFRVYDYFLFRLTGSVRKLGIMQVESDHFISDFESIQIVYSQLEKLYQDSSLKGKKRIQSILKDYCMDYCDVVQYIFEIIQKF